MVNFKNALTEHLQFGFLLASFGHDLDHTGRSNIFEVRIGSKLALRYSDQSPLEYNHIYILFKIAMNPDNNLFD